ncbi:AC55 [Trabala vishnou gigantina nucleopolyhedrovirus]|uniref:AC55 n=1 Tax=Trabala vishnou gigantina nucleopolyhedrovirus TaxID=2863583 RepID=UPI002481C2AA|nr:AC55 [Trabala vishnou gigantina nucleopolyhedrovirus]QYC92790.1 AC55 [Trabala vishnou gigantina nucleopolyhedrovirus]
MSQINFKLSRIIDKTIESNYKIKPAVENLAVLYAKCKEDINKVGRHTTYDVVGQRNFKNLFNEKKYKF